jgi:hypothetical protein
MINEICWIIAVIAICKKDSSFYITAGRIINPLFIFSNQNATKLDYRSGYKLNEISNFWHYIANFPYIYGTKTFATV